MTTEGFKRKLTAILSADVKGYSRLMGEDEVATVRTLTAYREVMAALIQKHRGRVVDSPGDNLLAEFASVVDAVQCAVDIQKELKARNAELPENRRMEFRIGVNLGDVIEEGDRIYGDGVNIAARVEGLAEGGGICISGTVYDHIENKLPLGYEYLGEHAVKNITKPVRVHRVLMEPMTGAPRVVGEKRAGVKRWQWAALALVVVLVVGAGALVVWKSLLVPSPPLVEVASEERMAFPLPEKPSIAVLPFDNLSGDPEQEYLADGMTENIITVLSNISEMFVIARNSTFTYKGKPVKVQKVAEDLGVRYVLEGSVQKAGDRVRVTAQLIDATKGHHLWADRYDRDFKDVFALQDEITLKILTALQVKLTRGEEACMHETTDNLEAWGYFVRALSLFERFTKEDNARARELFERAVKLDPEYAAAWTMLAWTHWIDASYGFSESRAESFKGAVELAQKAVGLDDRDPDVHALLGGIHLFQGRHEQAIAEGKKAIALRPNNACNLAILAQTVSYAGRFEEAIALVKKAMRLNPYYPEWYLGILAQSYRIAGRYDEAITTYKEFLDRSREGGGNTLLAHLGLAAIYVRLGREEEARAHAAKVLRIDPNFSLQWVRKATFFKDPAHLEEDLNALRKAGLPDNPPLPLPEKPSVAVLPFINMSDDPKQEYFSDGLTEEIITALSKVPRLFVIARNSTFTYKGKSVKIQRVGRELGVRYVVEGSVRKSGDRVRITAQLIDATTGHHLWAERYDRDLKDIFALQDEITLKILMALQVKLTEGEQRDLRGRGTDNLDAYLKFLQSSEHAARFTKEDNVLARQLLEEAIALDPGYAMPYLRLSATHLMDLLYGSSKSPKQSLRLAQELVQKALALDANLAEAYAFLGRIYLTKRQHEKAIAEGERALALAPNSDFVHAALAFTLRHSGRPEEAIALFKKAIRLNPIPPAWYLWGLGFSYFELGQYEEAIAEFRKALHRAPDSQFSHMGLAAAYSELGRDKEARAAAAEVLNINPKFSLEQWAKTHMYKNQADFDRFVEALRKAGLK